MEEGEGALGDRVQCRNVLKIRRRKMNRHKYKKLLKRRKFIRRRIKEGRKKKRQVSSGEGEFPDRNVPTLPASLWVGVG